MSEPAEPARQIVSLRVGADRDRWESAGFTLDRSVCRVGAVAIELTGVDGGPAEVRSWALQNLDPTGFDGLGSHRADARSDSAPLSHRNGVVAIDHLVVLSVNLERTTRAFESAGVRCRRRRSGSVGPAELEVDQAFFRIGAVIVEVVAVKRPGRTRFWGLTFEVEDLDAAADLLGDRLGSIRDAVQPGRRIATLKSGAGLGVPVALISRAEPAG